MKSELDVRIRQALGFDAPTEIFAKTKSFKSAWPGLIELAVDRLLKHGDLLECLEKAEAMPVLNPQELQNALSEASYAERLNRPAPLAPLIDESHRKEVNACLESLIPWKKGPFQFASTNQKESIYLDAEWQCF